MNGMQDIGKVIATVEQVLSQRLSPRRWAHTQGVQATAAQLALRHGRLVEPVRLAALLHDCAKEMKRPTLEELVQAGEVEADPFTLHTHGLHHTIVGCWVAQREFHVTDPAILEAIRYHSIGRPGLGPVAELVYIADWVEPGRPFPWRETLLQLCLDDLEAGLDEVAHSKVAFALHRRRPVHPLAVAYYNERMSARSAAQATGESTSNDTKGTGMSESVPPGQDNAGRAAHSATGSGARQDSNTRV